METPFYSKLYLTGRCAYRYNYSTQRLERLEKRIEEQAKEIERLRSELSAKEKAATSRKK